MSEADAAFATLLPNIKKLEQEYKNISLDDPIARGHVGRKILQLVDEAGLSIEYLRHCEQQRSLTLTESDHIRITCMICIITARRATH